MSNQVKQSAKADDKANVEADAEEQKVDGEDKSDEQKYTATYLETAIKDRVLREQKKFAKERADLEKKLSDYEKKATSNVEEDLRSKLTQYETEKKATAEKLDKYRQESLSSKIERALVAQDCLDPEVVRDHFLGRNLVHLDDDDELVVENLTGSLDDLVKDYLLKKPHLKRAPQAGGVGSKGPIRPMTVNGPQDMTADELGAQLGVKRKTNSFFGR